MSTQEPPDGAGQTPPDAQNAPPQTEPEPPPDSGLTKLLRRFKNRLAGDK